MLCHDSREAELSGLRVIWSEIEPYTGSLRSLLVRWLSRLLFLLSSINMHTSPSYRIVPIFAWVCKKHSAFIPFECHQNLTWSKMAACLQVHENLWSMKKENAQCPQKSKQAWNKQALMTAFNFHTNSSVLVLSTVFCWKIANVSL